MDDYQDYLEQEKKAAEPGNKIHIALLFAVLVVIVISMGVYSSSLRAATMGDMEAFLNNDGNTKANLFDSIVTGAENAINILAMIESVSWDGTGVSIERIHELKDESSFSVVGYCDAEGRVITSEGGIFIVGNAEYFVKGMQGEKGYLIVLNSVVTQKNYLLSYAPIVYNGEVKGVLIGGYDGESMGNFLAGTYYSMPVRTILSTPDGTVITCFGCSTKRRSLRELFESDRYRQNQFEDGYTLPVDDDSKCYQIMTADGFDFVKYSFCPYSGWIITEIIPDETTGRILNDNYRALAALQLICVGSVAFYMLVLVLYERSKSKNLARRNAISDNIITAIISLFTKVIEIDLRDDTYRFITLTDSSDGHLPARGRYSDLVDHFKRLAYDEEARKNIADAAGSMTLKRTLDDEDNYRSFEYHLAGEPGKWEKIFIIPLKKGLNGIDKVLLCAEDITLFKLQDARSRAALMEAYTNAEKANSAKTSFLASMSHDIRTPMNAIVGMTQIAESHINDIDRVKDCLKKISLSSGQLLDLINDVLDMSKIESGKDFLQEETFALSELTDGFAIMAETQTAVKKQHIDVIASDFEHPVVIGDKGRIRQIMNNIISNAFKYTPENGNIKIILDEKSIDRAGFTMLEFTVSDDGIGMSREFRENLFRPFTRATDDERLERIQGTGLGMAITKNLVEMMNGNIRVSSELNKGTTFVVTLILKTAEEEKKETKKKQDLIRDFSGKRCLLVEDNEINSEIATELIGMTQMAVERVKDGKEAVDKVRALAPDYYDIIFMDIQMPVMNGLDASSAIRDLPDPKYKNIPIIALTANAFAEDVQAARNAGMNEHLAKPLEFEKLIKVLNDFVKM